MNAQSIKPRAETEIGNTIEHDVKSCPVKNDYSKMYKIMPKRIEV